MDRGEVYAALRGLADSNARIADLDRAIDEAEAGFKQAVIESLEDFDDRLAKVEESLRESRGR